MDKTTVFLIKASLVYLFLGTLLGVLIAVQPDWTGYLVSVHVHLNLVGFMAMMVFGVGYHVLPRFSGRAIHNPKLIPLQVWTANVGLWGMALGFVLRPTVYDSLGTFLLGAFGSVELGSVLLFAYNMLKTLPGQSA